MNSMTTCPSKVYVVKEHEAIYGIFTRREQAEVYRDKMKQGSPVSVFRDEWIVDEELY